MMVEVAVVGHEAGQNRCSRKTKLPMEEDDYVLPECLLQYAWVVVEEKVLFV